MSRDSFKVLVVDDDPMAVKLTSRMLENAGYEVLTAENGVEALRVMAQVGPPLVVTDWMMPEMDGVEFTRAVREHTEIGFVFIVLVTAQNEADRLVEAFEAGVDDYVTKPFNQRELLARLRAGERIVELQHDLDRRQLELHRANAEMQVANARLDEANKKLHLMATTDELTGLTNRRAAMALLADQWAAACRHPEPMSCVMLDIDHFKSFNDTHGHAVGDLVLRETAQTLAKTARQEERVCRVGGEEFLVLCPHAKAAEAAVAAERMRKAIEAHVFKAESGDLSVTISLGVAQREEGMAAADDLLRASDDALYAAKEAGRNKVCLAGQGKRDAEREVPIVEIPAGGA